MECGVIEDSVLGDTGSIVDLLRNSVLGEMWNVGPFTGSFLGTQASLIMQVNNCMQLRKLS